MLKSRMSIAVLMVVVLVVLMGGGYAIAQTVQRNSPTTQIKNSWELTKLSGHYSFRTEVNQYTNPEPRISNYGATASHMHYRIEGNTDESTQTTEVLITNITADGESKIAIRRVRGRTYVMQPDLTWQEVKTSTTPSQLGSLSYLAGMSTATQLDANSYNFAYDGSAYVANMQRLLNIDANHGIRYEDSFTEITRSQQAIETTGKGELHTDGDGLPSTLSLNLTMPPNNRETAKRLMIQTTFFGYARTGFALQAAIHDPIHQLSRLLGANAAQVQSWFFAAVALLVLCVGVALVQLFGRRMYFPITVIVIAMTIYQPYATIPASQAATNSTTQPTPVPAVDTNQTPPKPFNPLISPLAQPMGIALPAAGTSSPDMTTIVTNQRGYEQGTETDCKALTDADKTTDTDGDGLTNAQECQYHTILNSKDSDADTLTDLQEIRLGTDPNIIDTDGDGITDFVEVTIPSVINNQAFYTSPFERDTNNDGLQDGLECAQHLKDVINLSSPQNCTATTGNVPDFLSVDNDADGVPDSVDIMPYQWSGATAYTSANPFKYSVTGAQGATSRVPLTLDIQIRPNNPQFLYANGAVYAWPVGDTLGQIQHTFATTFKNPKDPIYKSASDNAGNGNVRVTAVLEIQVPIKPNSNTHGVLPVFPGCGDRTSLTATCQQGSELVKGDTKPAWLDVAKLAKYNMTASWGRTAYNAIDTTLLVLNVPLQPVYNSSKSIVAYNATVMYEPALNQVISEQNARLQWIVTSLQDQCQTDASGRCNDALPRIESIGNVQTYYDDFVITGLQASELLGETDAVFYEDASKPTVLNSARRLHIARLAGVLGQHFVDTPNYKMETDANCQINQATCTSITDIFNQNKPMNAQYVHGIDTSAIKNRIFTYTDSLDATKLYISDIHTLLDGMIPAAARTTCGSSTAPNCRPGVVVASEIKKRYANAITLSATTTNVITIDSAVSVARSSRGAIWRYDTTNAKWVMVDVGDYDVEKNSILQGMNLSDTTAKPANVDVNTWQKWLAIIPQSVLVNLQRNFVMVYDQATLTTAAKVVRTDATVWNNWDTFTRKAVVLLQPIVQYIVDTAPYNPQSPLYKSGAKISDYMASQLDSRLKNNANTRDAIISPAGIAIGAIALVLVSLIVYKFAKTNNQIAIGGAVVIGVVAIFVIVGLVDDVSAVQKWAMIAIAAFTIIYNIANIVSTVMSPFNALLNGAGPISQALALFKIGISITMGILNIMSAKYEFQRLNAGFTMVGEIAATAVMFALQFAIGMTGVGLVVLAVLAVIDSIATITCSFLSAKARRSSAAQWLCGGITGLLANFLTFYKASVAVDRDDPYSYQQDIKPLITLEKPVQGYVKDNQAKFTLKITDYIEKMPRPASWQSLFWGWQWTNLDERSSAFDYKLDSTDYNLSGGLSIDSQTWSENLDRSTYDLPYMKSEDFSKSLYFATTGINQPMPGMRLSMGWKVRKQTCYGVFLFSVCIMGEFAQDEHKDITKANEVIYDIMPETFAKFMEMEPGSSAGTFTFAWNSDSSTLKFPDFKDADNDGVLVSDEIIKGTSDTKYDTDSDGVDDKAEITFGTDANKKDTDGDGLSDLEEIQYGTTRNNKDTDGDGLLDSEEIVRSVNGVRVGGWEVTYDIVNGVPLKTWMSSDPLNADADQDNLIDLRERILGTSPYAANNANILSMSDTKLNEALNPRVLLDFEQGMLGAKGGVAGGNATSTFSCGALGCPKAVADVVNGRATTVADFGTTGNGLLLNLGSQQISPTFSAAFWVKPVLQATAVSQLLRIGDVIIYRSNITRGICVSVSLICSNGGVPDNQWTHVALVSDGKFIKIYLNGVQTQIHTVIGSANPLKNITSGVMLMGCDGCNDPNRFYGSMDDVALFNTALTKGDVDQLRSGTLANRSDNVVRPGDRVTLQASLKNELLGRSLQGYTTFSSQSGNTNVVTKGDLVPFAMSANAATTTQNTLTVPGIVDPVQTGATRYLTQGCQYMGAIFCLKLDESNTIIAQKTFTDISTNNYIVECVNSNGGTQATCPRYNSDGWEFGQNNDFSRLNIPTQVVQQLDNSDFTIGLRFRFTGTASLSKRTLIANDTGTFRLGLTDNKPSISMPGMADIVAPTVLSNNTWYQLTYRVAKSIATLYVNGIAVAQGPTSVLLANFSGYSFQGAYFTDYIPTFTGTRSPSNVSALYVGSDNAQNLNATGTIRDVQFYNNALSDYQIQAWGQGCNDALLIACVNPSGNDGAIDQDASVFGGTEQVKLTRASWSPNPIFQGTAALVVGEPATIQKNLPNGYESLLNQQDFTIVSKIQVPSTCAYLPILTSTIGGTRLGLDGSCRPRVMLYTDPNVAAVISRALTPGLAVLSLTVMSKLNQYRITLYQSGIAPMSAVLNNQPLHLQDPITIHSALVGQSPYLVNFRIYKTVLDDANISAIASSLLGSQDTSVIGITPRTDVLTFNAEARVKVMQSDPDFEHDSTSGDTTQMQLAFDEPALSSNFRDIINMPRADNIVVTCDTSTCPQSGVPGVTGNALWFNSAPKGGVSTVQSLIPPPSGSDICLFPIIGAVANFLNSGYYQHFHQNTPSQPYLGCAKRTRSYPVENAQWLTLPVTNQFMKFLTNGTPADNAQTPATFDFWIKPAAYGGRIIDHKLLEIGLDSTGHITVKHALNQSFTNYRNFWWSCLYSGPWPFVDEEGTGYENQESMLPCLSVGGATYSNGLGVEQEVSASAYRRYDWPRTATTSSEVVPLGQWSHITVQTNASGDGIVVNGGSITNRTSYELDHIYEDINDPVGDLKIGYGYSGYLDNLTVSKDSGNVFVPTPSKPLTMEPNWALDFEDYNVQQTRRPDNSIAVLDTLATPKSNQTRNGVARYSTAATCIGVFATATCPMFGVAGQNGLAASFNGTTSILEVKNPDSIMSAMPNNVGGTMQLALQPKAAGTVFYYGTPSGDIGLKVEINSELKLQITAKDNASNPTTFTTNSPLPKTWNVLSLSWGNGTLKYYLNGVDNTSTLDKSSSFNVLPNASYRIFIGGRIDASGNAANLFTGDIDDISLTPGSLPRYYHFASARMQYAQSMVNTAIGSVTVDADNPVVTVTTPEYAPGTGQMFQISASDATSAISRVDTTIRPLGSGSALNITTPVCSDTINDNADPKTATYCPFLPSNSEGRYDVTTTVYDAVSNRGLSQTAAIGSGTVFIDTTAPTAALLLPTRSIAGTLTTVPYTTTSEIGSNTQLLRLRIDVRDPVLRNSGNHAGSGVKEVALTLKNVNGSTIVKSTPAAVVNGAWQSDLAIPLANPNGFYLLDATVKDEMGNQATLTLAGTANPIEIDSAPPHDVIVSPSPLTANLYLVGPSNLTNNSITGRVSDLYDGRPALQRGLRVKLDFEANDGAKEFDNRANTRYVSDCSTCPTVAYDMMNGQRIARFNIEGTNQFISVHNATGAIDNVFSIAMQFKINDSGTLLSSGFASNPRIRVKATKMLNGTGYTVSVYRGNKTISTPPLVKDTWYNLIYTEADNKMGLQVGTSYTAMLQLVETPFVTADTPAEANILLIGAIRSGANSAAVEDPFRGYIDNIMVSSNFLTPSDLIGKDVANGSGTTQHQTRFAVRDDGFAENDNLAPVTEYFVPFNQSVLPVVDVMRSLKSAVCNGALTAPGISCPAIVAGFTSNAMQFGKETDGVWMGYAITQTQNTGKTYSLRVKIPTGSQSGRLLTIAPNVSGAAVRITMNYNAITQQVSTTISDTAAVATVLPMTMLDDQWHTVSLVTNALTTTTTVAAYLDNAQVGGATIQGLLQNANLSLGAVRQFVAAKGAMIDDVGVFTTAFNMNQLRSLVFGNGPVYFETFDMIDTSADSTRPDDSLFAQPSNYRNTQATPGLVGSGALNSGATTVVNHIDSRGLSWVNPNEPWSISTWLKFNSTSNSGVIARNREGSASGANGAFVLEKIGAKLKFSHWNQSITTGDVITQTTTPMHVVMNSDGQTMALWVNGQNVITGTVATGGNDTITNNLTKLVQPGQSPTASSTATGSNRDNATDSNATTVFTTNSETNPWWQYSLGANPVRIDQIVIRNIPNSATTLHRLHVIVSNDANTTYSTADSSAVWQTFIPGNLGAITVLQLPYGTMGRFVRVQIEGPNEVLALPEIEINQALVLNLNSTMASIDDFRLYRHGLTPVNITTLGAMSWRASTLTARQDGFSWQRQLPSGLEIDAKIQSTTTDRNDNTRVGVGEQTLWDGRIDTRAPRVDAREIPIANTNLYSYTVQIDERNLNVNLLQTPCGSRFKETLSVATSLWYRVRSSAFDGSFIEPTHLDGGCVYGDTPDVVQQLAQPISTTKSIVFGSRYAYAGGVNTVSVIDTQNTVNLVQNSVPVVGTVLQLLMSRNKNRLYALSTSNTPTNRVIITIFDIPTNNSTLTLRGSVAVPLAAGATLQDGALTSYYDASVYTDNFLQLLVNSTPQQIISVQVSNPDQPTQITSTSLDVSVTSYDMDASYDIVALAQGIGGIAFWQVNSNGTMQYKSSYRTGSYLNRVIFKDTTAIVIDDDEPYTSGAQPTSPNTMRIVPVISSVAAGQATLINPIVAQSNYVHIVPTSTEDVAPYRILDVTPYLGGDVVALSADSSNANRFRLSMISIDTITPTLRSDTLITNANVKRVVSSNNSILTMANSGQASQLQAFVVTDRRLATRLCDQAGNCTAQAPRSRSTLRLSRTAPVQGSVQIINVTDAYTTTTQSLTFHAEAPSGVQTIQMKIDGNAPQTVWTAPSGDPLAAVEADTTLTGLSQKSHTVQGINNFNNLLTAKTQYYAPIIQATLPITDVLYTVGSDSCIAGNTAPGITCPAIVSGFSGNALQLSNTTDGIRMGYAITQTMETSRSVSMRIKIPSNGVSGRIATIAPLTGSDPALKLWFDYDSTGSQINTSLVDTSGITQTSAVSIPDTAWHLLTVVSSVVTDSSTIMIYLDGALVESMAGPGMFTNAALVLGATPLNSAATNVMVDDIAVFSDALTSDNLQDLLAGDVITPKQTVTPVYTFFVDNVAPQITLIDKFIGFNRIIDGIITARLVITDVSDLVSIQTINQSTGSQIGNSYARVGDVTNVNVFYPEAIVQGTVGVITPTLPLSIITTDSAQHTTTLNTFIQIDNDPPVVVNGVTNAAVNGVITPIAANIPVTRTNNLDLHVGWTQLRDLVSVPLKVLEYTVQTITDTQSLTTSVTLSNRSPAMLTREGSRIVPSLRLRDSIGNEGVTALPIVYVDSAVTPDYTQIATTNEIYRGWLGNGCATLGESNVKGLQRFTTTWDSQNLRINWQGADWNVDGDLFIYLDSIDGGTVQPYRPSKYTQTLTDSVALGDAFVTLPVNMAGRSIGLSSSAASWATRLLNAQQAQPRATTIQGADYVIHVQSSDTVTLLRWDSGMSNWTRESMLPEFRYGTQNSINQTDLRIPFSQINYVIGQPFGMVAFASAKTALLPWAVFPTTNPTRLDRGTDKIVLTPLLNGYSWSTLGDGVCPRKDAGNPDTTQVVSSLTSTPSGSYQRTISDNFVNTDPDAIANAIMQTQAMCAVLTSDSWCKTVSQLADTTTAGSAILAGFANTLVSQQTPVVGDNSVVTYTLQIQNTSNRPTRPLYGIVRTYGGIWLTGTVNAGATTGIISGNVYDYHTVANPNYYDYQVVKIDRIPANSSQSVIVRAKIDPRKSQPSDADRMKTSTVAKIEVRITDDSSATALNSTARTIEWLNAGIRIDTQAPTLIHADNQQVVRTGNVVLTGSVKDDSTVPNVQLEYRFDSSKTTAMGCGMAVAGQWRCAITVPSTATTMNYRVRASDTYNQLSPWSAWYSAQIDRDKPIFQLDAASINLLGATYVGGKTIQISGLLSDTTSTADMMVCDEQQANCAIASTTSQIRPTTTYTTTVATTMAIAAQPCATTDLEGYTRYPINVTTAGTSRIGALTVNTSIAHGAANEVDVWLESPSGTRVALLNTDRGAGVNIRATFADTAVASSTTLTGTTALGATYKLVKPDGTLADFASEPGNGTWALLACDRTSNGTNGNIIGAELVITSATNDQSVNAPWTFTLANTANQDNVTRRIQFWAKDAAGNVSNAQNTTVRIDTVEPGMTVFQNAVIVLPSTASVPFQGTISDGGQIQSLTANVYAGTSQVATIALTPIEATSNEVKRLNYLLNRALRTYTWNMPLDTTTYAAGNYQVQFVVRDTVGNRRTSDAYTINVPVKTLPGIRDIQVTGSLNANEQTIRYKLDTGYSVTAVNAQIVLDSSITTPYTGTVVQGWKDDGTSDTVLQAAIPAAIQTKQITKLDMNNDFAAALDRDGVLYTWPIDADPDHQLTSNEIAGVTPIRDIVQFSIAEQYAWDNYLLTLDRAGRVTEYNRHVDDPHVVKTVVLNTTYQNGKIIGIDAGYRHNVALLSTGKVISWWHDVCEDLDDPDNDPPAYCDPSSPNYPITIPTKAQYGVAQVQAGVDFSVALRNDGTVVAWGSPINNHLAIPATIKTVTQIAVGAEHVVALQEDGTVVAWGENSAGQTIVPEGLSDVIFVAAGGASSAAVTRSGKVVAWGETDFVKQGGASAVALNYSYCTPADECGTDWVQTGQSPTASSILTGSNVDYATDNNSATSFSTNLETNPWWQYPLGATSVPVNQIVISSPRIRLSQNTKLHVMVSDNPNTTLSSADWNWHYVTDTVDVNMLLDLPLGITGKYVRLQLEGTNEVLSLSGIEIYQTNGNFDVPAQVITVNQTATQTKSQQVNAAVSFNTGTAVFTGVIPGRRYRYTLTATNTQGTQTYTGTFTSNQTFNRLYMPLLSNSSPVAPPASSGR